MFHSWDDDSTNDAIKDALREGDASRALSIMNRAEERRWSQMYEYDSRPPITDPGLLPPTINGRPKSEVMKEVEKEMCEKSVHPIDLWVEKNPYIKELINDLVEHLDNSVSPTPENGIDDFKRLAAISIRQFLEDQ